MHIREVFEKNRTSFSFEFFPPKDRQASETLYTTIADLTPLDPSFVSVTYGAGGSTRELTHEVVVRLQRETNLTVVSHLTCVGHTKDEIRAILEKYIQSGIENILALRGDPPAGHGAWTPVPGGFNHAGDLVSFIKREFPSIGVGVAGFPEGHPSTPNRLKEIDLLKEKVDAGADYICTQLFFENRDFYDFCERCELAGIRIPIIAGIMPVTSTKNMRRMADLALGARFPARLLRALQRAENDDYVAKVGVHWATEQVRDLLDNKIKGIHFYTLNRSKATIEIYQNLGVSSSKNLG